ncbi:MAG: hypothetical protein AB1728_09520 [Bacteroidota bacterium]
MKTRTAITLAAILIVLQYGMAGEQAKRFATEEAKIEFAKRNLMKGLKSDNAGVVESAMRVTALMKMRYPSTDVSYLVREIGEIAAEHPSGKMRYKAYITLNICEDPVWYVQEQSVRTADDLNFFRNASARMQQKLLGVNSL